MASQQRLDKNESILIVGAGVFGLSTALELKKRGYTNVTVLDRFLPPVIDGSSVDISRVIRVEYADPLYGQMAREALQGWISEYKSHYYQSGFVMLADAAGNSYMEKSQEVAKSAGQTIAEYTNNDSLKQEFPSIQANLHGLKAYGNPRGGWADAESAIRELSQKCTISGVCFITGNRGKVLSLRYEGQQVIGVNVAEGGPILASQVIISAGAWSNRLVSLSHATSASGQPVGFIQLTPSEADQLRGMPVIINLKTGVFCFPPTPDTNILKVARHGYGFATEVSVNHSPEPVSSPKFNGNNVDASYIPQDAEQALREGLQQLVPEFANHPWMNRRLCWYSDTPEGHFVVDHHPKINGLFLATGGAGHAFKFLPVLGRYIVDCFEDKSSKEIRRLWKLREPSDVDNELKKGDGSRAGPPLRVLSKTEQAKL